MVGYPAQSTCGLKYGNEKYLYIFIVMDTDLHSEHTLNTEFSLSTMQRLLTPSQSQLLWSLISKRRESWRLALFSVQSIENNWVWEHCLLTVSSFNNACSWAHLPQWKISMGRGVGGDINKFPQIKAVATNHPNWEVARNIQSKKIRLMRNLIKFRHFAFSPRTKVGFA